MERRIQDELDTIKEIIVNTVPVEQIFLFGSYATGTAHDHSDLDIYVIMPDDATIRDIDAIRMIRKAIRDKKTMPVDVAVSKKNKFNYRKSTPTMEQEIAQKGVVIYG